MHSYLGVSSIEPSEIWGETCIGLQGKFWKNYLYFTGLSISLHYNSIILKSIYQYSGTIKITPRKEFSQAANGHWNFGFSIAWLVGQGI